ncbi:lysophospholipid acyltransferase family protein [Microbacterium terrisoli]|jgi:1-acyl-sn-glycerol-3-phosphate acyltransferase|uniref:lysophospholipid acyltransferase family protein n=1 Tax=Microbacterium terrisoli TaxID=3242192 RepID=UPI002805CA0B|nr:lysophospholipid acyltransferase family protein [Microbacterium protaetiae]
MGGDQTQPTSAGTSDEKRKPSVFWVLAAIVLPIFGLFARVEIRGAEKLPRTGPFVLAVNHHSEIDPLVVALAVWRIGRAPRFMAKESLFRVPVLGWALRATGMIPVARATTVAAARETITQSRLLVEHGRGVIVYPEGTLTRDPDLWPMRGKSGAVRLAMSGKIPLIPMAQWGAQELLPRYGKLRLWPLRKRMTVLLGDPVDVSEFVRTRSQPATIAQATTKTMNAIAELLAQLRGIPAPPERWDPVAHGQRETGRLDSET